MYLLSTGMRFVHNAKISGFFMPTETKAFWIQRYGRKELLGRAKTLSFQELSLKGS